jgi:hypothetical protein
MNNNYEEREDGIYKKDKSVQKGNADFFFHVQLRPCAWEQSHSKMGALT